LISLENLLIRYSRDDAEAFAPLFKAAAPGLERYLRRRLKNPEAREDVLQMIFMQIHHYRHRYDSKYLAWQWLYVIARSELSTYCRRRSVEESTLDFSEHLSQIPDDSPNTEVREHLEELLHDIPDEDKLLLVDKFMEEKTYEEIAEDLGLSSQSLRKRVSRLLKNLKEKVYEP
jgi:RNA polymerase sigma-70 factor, ECF subfamily